MTYRQLTRMSSYRSSGSVAFCRSRTTVAIAHTCSLSAADLARTYAVDWLEIRQGQTADLWLFRRPTDATDHRSGYPSTEHGPEHAMERSCMYRWARPRMRNCLTAEGHTTRQFTGHHEATMPRQASGLLAVQPWVWGRAPVAV
jgi:hypothetical protein